MENLTLGLREAAAALGLSTWTLRAWIRQGRLRAVKLGRRTLVEPGELHRLLEAGRRQAAQ